MPSLQRAVAGWCSRDGHFLMISQRLTMRAEFERSTSSGTDAWGQPVAAAFEPLCVLACFAWTPSAREIFDGNKVAAMEDVRMLLPLSAEVNENDQVAQITNMRGTVLFNGPFRVDGPVQFKHTHREAALVRVA